MYNMISKKQINYIMLLAKRIGKDFKPEILENITSAEAANLITILLQKKEDDDKSDRIEKFKTKNEAKINEIYNLIKSNENISIKNIVKFTQTSEYNTLKLLKVLLIEGKISKKRIFTKKDEEDYGKTVYFANRLDT